ncbi:MAG: hypothetical protein IJV45_03200 [Prevotella sp.]|nr:hypothetical protein [Prevotella sp.]
MVNKDLLLVSLRQRALYLPGVVPQREARARSLQLVVELRQLGFSVTEPLLHALNGLTDDDGQCLVDALNEVMGTHLNWASLVRGWLVPTGEGVWDHFLTLVANIMKDELQIPGTTLPCGHLIPEGTFPLERYTGCPFCGTPFETAPGEVYRGQGTKLRQLSLWDDADLERHFQALLASPVPLDATQRESLKTLLGYKTVDGATVKMKETLMLVVDSLVGLGRDDEAGRLLTSPTDVLRYLWQRHTGRLQLLRPATLLNIERKNQRHGRMTPEDIAQKVDERRRQLRLSYPRPWCRRVARWMNGLAMPLDQQLEAMHPQREMWVRFIRALRLAEYARKPGYEQLQTLLDRFYRRDYRVWQGRVDESRRRVDADATMALLRQRPGLFARCLFSSMLTFGPDAVTAAFREVVGAVKPRLLISLATTAELYFDRSQERVARPLSGVMHPINPHPLLAHYTDAELERMKQLVRDLYLEAMRRHFKAQPSLGGTIYIDPELDHIPVSVGDRSQTVQDISAALQGQRFAVSGDSVRLFLQWGAGLPAQHLDMDLSCAILGDGLNETCAYYNLVVKGAKHSGDIQHIPDQVGTAEYIELSLPELEERGARRVVFTCNAFTQGALQPNLMVGWMSADVPMTVSNETGVAYDPSTVDHMVRITEGNLSKGLIFGVLDVAGRYITWLEMPFDGQTVRSISPESIDAFLQRLARKPTIGQVLRLMADAQHLTPVAEPGEADRAFTLQWAQDAAEVSRLLLSNP